MPIFALDDRHIFPDPELADDSGLLAIGGDLDARRVLLAYTIGIFPWYSEGQPILWHSPDPRFVLFPEELKFGRSLRRRVKAAPYEITLDRDFEAVIRECAKAPRPGQDGTWITDEMNDCYLDLFERGYAHSVEAWLDGELVGGLYGVAIGGIYFGESMFAKAPDASKIAFVHLVRQLAAWDFELIDSQVYTDHLARFGARHIPRGDYLARLRTGVLEDNRKGRWEFDEEVVTSS